jgi:hypothetical protein
VVAEEEQEGLKGLVLDGHRFARLEERESALAKFEVAEAVNKGLSSHHRFANPTIRIS